MLIIRAKNDLKQNQFIKNKLKQMIKRNVAKNAIKFHHLLSK